MPKEHHYYATVQWTGNTGSGTSNYNSYERSHLIKIKNKANIQGSSDPSFRGDHNCHNPEELLLASLSACHMLWYLHLCAVNNVVVLKYTDNANGFMEGNEDGTGIFIEVSLNPIVIVGNKDMILKAEALHQKANKMCYIANSVKFPVKHNALTKVDEIKFQE